MEMGAFGSDRKIASIFLLKRSINGGISLANTPKASGPKRKEAQSQGERGRKSMCAT